MRKEKCSEESWQRYLEYSRKKYQEKREYYKSKNIEWRKNHPGYKQEYNATHREENKVYAKKYYGKNKYEINETRKTLRQTNIEYDVKCKIKSLKYYCNNIELVENYELAEKDNFKNWHLHHRLENFWSSKTLKKKKIYYKINPEALIFLPSKEHRIDSIISRKHPEQTKWHQRKLENV